MVGQMLTVRDLLEWFGWKQGVVTFLVTVGVATWAFVLRIPGPVLFVLSLFAGVGVILIWRIVTLPKPTLENANNYAGAHPPELVRRVQVALERSPAARGAFEQLMQRGEMEYAELISTSGGRAASGSGAVVLREFPKERGEKRPYPRCFISELYKPILRDVLYGQSTGENQNQRGN
jgi:hypothetical protein